MQLQIGENEKAYGHEEAKWEELKWRRVREREKLICKAQHRGDRQIEGVCVFFFTEKSN